MTEVFIGGSRDITKLPLSVCLRIERIVEGGFAILIGDASGADRCVQQYLAEKRYKNVSVFHSGAVCRNNIGNWRTKSVAAAGEKGFDFYALKDSQMARESDYGFMIWNGKSKGTLNNVFNLLSDGKKTLVFFLPDQTFYSIFKPEDLCFYKFLPI